MTIKLLCAADFHLGRRTSRVPEGVNAPDCSPSAAWKRLVERACETRPDAVLLAGDLVDESNKYYEAYGPLESGVRRLVESGVAVCAVAGNHDYEVLARLSKNIRQFKLLGRDGAWEEYVLEKEGRKVLRIRGFSFNQKIMRKSPLDEYHYADDGGPPVVGLLHCDLDASDSVYGPVVINDLLRTDAKMWVLGHIHKPAVRHEDYPRIFYCGSPQGMDPSETGSHGAWEATIEEGGSIRIDPVPLAGLRWETAEVPVDGIEDRDAFDHAVLEAMRRVHELIAGELGPVMAVGCRLRLKGRTRVHREMRRWIGEANMSQLRLDLDGVQYFLNKLIDEAGPALRLEEEAQGVSPPALLAKKLLVLQKRIPNDEYGRIITDGRKRMTEAVRKTWFFDRGGAGDTDDEAIRGFLMRSGMHALELLKAQKEEGV